MWTAIIRVNGREKNITIEADTEWNARKIAFKLCKGLREKKKSAVLLSLDQKEEPENG